MCPQDQTHLWSFLPTLLRQTYTPKNYLFVYNLMLFSKFRVVQPLPRSSLMCPSSMFNSTKQNTYNMNSHLPDLMLR